MTTPLPRPSSVTAAFWLWLVSAVLLVAGGLLAASASIAAFYRGAGVIFAVAGLMIGFLAGRARNGDARFRRAVVALSLGVIVLVGMCGVFGVVHVLALLAVIPLIVAAMLASRPTASAWFDTPETGDQRSA